MSSDEYRSLLHRSPVPDRSNLSHTATQRIVCALILIAQGLERLACYSIIGNLAFFLTQHPFCWSDSTAFIASIVANGTMWIIGLFAGWLSDSTLGRYWTIVCGYILYIAAYCYMPILTSHITKEKHVDPRTEGTPCTDNDMPPVGLCWGGDCQSAIFVFTAVTFAGSGIVRTNLAAFGGDQVRSSGSVRTRWFFNWYYWSINVGAFVSQSAIPFLQQKTFFLSFLITTGALVTSFLFFLCGTVLYIRRPAKNNIIIKILKMITESFSQRSRMKGYPESEKPTNFLDYSHFDNGGTFSHAAISDIKSLWRVFKGFLLFLPYWISYSQVTPGTNYLLQGLHLRVTNVELFGDDVECEPSHKLHYNSIDFCSNSSFCSNCTKLPTIEIPASTLQSFNVLPVLLILPVIGYVYSALAKKGVRVSFYRRILFGYGLLVLSLVLGGVLEYYRLQNIANCGYHKQQIGNTIYDAAPSISIWWQVPQYTLTGASEVFVTVAGLEYAFMESPQSLQGLIMGLFFFVEGIGNFIGIGLPFIFHAFHVVWKDLTFINCNRLDIYFWALAALLLVGMLLFYYAAKKCELNLEKIICIPRIYYDDALPETPELVRRRGREHLYASTSYTSSVKANTH